jgi:hypothetical protein
MAKRFIIIFVVFLALAGVRIYYIHKERNTELPQPKVTRNENFSSDDYVTPKTLHVYDLKSAKEELDGKPVWVKSGWQIYYYPATGGRVDFAHDAGLLPPLEKLDIQKLVEATPPNAKAQEIAPGVKVRSQAVMAIFKRGNDPKLYACQVGSANGGDFTLYLNESFYYEDPHQLYKHWSADVWQAIDQHQAKPGMNELQASFALGIGTPSSGSDYGNRTLDFTNNGHPVKVTFAHNRATNIGAGT